MVIVVQIIFVYTSMPHFYFEKQLMIPVYNGELCSPIDTNKLEFVMILCAYILGWILKLINVYSVFYHEVRVEAKAKDMKIQDVVRLQYFHFYTTLLSENESNQIWVLEFFKVRISNILQNLFVRLYILAIVTMLALGHYKKDHELTNASTICMIDVFLDALGLIPNW